MCGLCNLSYSTHSELKRHILTHTKERAYKCLHCGKSYKQQSGLCSHVDFVHTNPTIYTCTFPDCAKQFNRKPNFYRHLIMVHDPESERNPIITCHICPQKFRKLSKQNHLRLHTWERKHKCDVCSKKFKTIDSLNHHKNTHLPKSEKPVFPCTLCDNKYCTKYTLKTHMKQKHSSESLNPTKSACTFCGSLISNMTQHLRIHTGEKPFACPLCDMTFPYSKALRIHVATTHISKGIYKCSNCSRTYGYEHQLKWHIYNCLKGKNHRCTICNKMFTSSDTLQYHIRKVHTLEKPFKCALCDKSFLSSRQLKAHSAVHTQERSFNCTKCNKSFKIKSGLYVHMRLHMKKSHTCELCDKVFSDPYRLKAHKMAVHKIKVSVFRFTSAQIKRLHTKFNCRPCVVVLEKINLY